MIFDEISCPSQKQHDEELQKDKLQAISDQQRAGRKCSLAFSSSFLKEIVLKIAYFMLGDRVLPFHYPIWVLSVPVEMKKMIEYFDFTPGGGVTSPLNMGMITYENTVAITFSTALTNRLLEKEFFTN
jgi:hypothetical protein